MCGFCCQSLCCLLISILFAESRKTVVIVVVTSMPAVSKSQVYDQIKTAGPMPKYFEGPRHTGNTDQSQSNGQMDSGCSTRRCHCICRASLSYIHM